MRSVTRTLCLEADTVQAAGPMSGRSKSSASRSSVKLCRCFQHSPLLFAELAGDLRARRLKSRRYAGDVARLEAAQNGDATRLEDSHPFRRQIGDPGGADVRDYNVGDVVRNNVRRPERDRDIHSGAFEVLACHGHRFGIVIARQYTARTELESGFGENA